MHGVLPGRTTQAAFSRVIRVGPGSRFDVAAPRSMSKSIVRYPAFYVMNVGMAFTIVFALNDAVTYRYSSMRMIAALRKRRSTHGRRAAFFPAASEGPEEPNRKKGARPGACG